MTESSEHKQSETSITKKEKITHFIRIYQSYFPRRANSIDFNAVVLDVVVVTLNDAFSSREALVKTII